jgi:hypothetical protein
MSKHTLPLAVLLLYPSGAYAAGEATRIMMALTHFGVGNQHFLLATPYISSGKAATRRGHQ